MISTDLEEGNKFMKIIKEFYNKIKKGVYDTVWIFEDKPINDMYDILIVGLIILNIVAIVLETVHSFHNSHALFFQQFDRICMIAFSVDYFFRIWSCTCNEKFKGIITGRVKYAFTPMAIVDLLSILPSFLPITDLRALRIFRLFRLFRIIKLSKYCKSFITIRKALVNKAEMLMSSFILIFIVLFILSTVVYYCECDIQPDKYSSIPHTLWWGVITLTSVGYGDIYPITTLGKFFTCVIAMLAIPLCAIPGGVIFSSITEEMKREEGNLNETMP